jgi:hypothetical protein
MMAHVITTTSASTLRAKWVMMERWPSRAKEALFHE